MTTTAARDAAERRDGAAERGHDARATAGTHDAEAHVPADRLARARQRLAALCDAGSIEPLRAVPEADTVTTAAGRIDGRRVVCFSFDCSHHGGALGIAEGAALVAALEHAGQSGVPVVGFYECAGANLKEGVAALGAYASVFRKISLLSRRIPQIAVLTGANAGGGAYAPALADVVIMSGEARAFLTGPKVVKATLGEVVTSDQLGGPRVHERNGVSQLTARAEDDAQATVRRVLSYLPDTVGGPLPRARVVEEPSGDPGAALPARERAPYDVGAVVERTVDAGSFLELAPKWAPNMVTGFARLAGEVVGVLCNQPAWLGGAIDNDGAEKAARFVNRCDDFRMPLLVFVDTPGFLPGRIQETEGLIGTGAQLVRAFSEATVPSITLILRKAFGGGYIAMNSRGLGAGRVLAWPGACAAVMGGRHAATVLHARDRGSLDEYGNRYDDEHVGLREAIEAGLVDDVIAPADTRRALIRAREELRHAPNGHWTPAMAAPVVATTAG
jgi:acetyl-CoA carboxylase carboxyltransferase component